MIGRDLSRTLARIPKPIRARLRIYRPAYLAVSDNLEVLRGERDALTPPRRIMYGVGGDDDYKTYELIGRTERRFLVEKAGLKSTHNLLDVGCGLGRVAAQLTSYLDPHVKYEGLDIVPAAIGAREQSVHDMRTFGSPWLTFTTVNTTLMESSRHLITVFPIWTDRSISCCSSLSLRI